MRIAVVVAPLLLVLCAADASAHHPVERKKRGTRFIAEASLGAALGTGFSEAGAGVSTRATLGFGGKIKGFPPRFYLIAAFRYSQLNASVQQNTLSSDISRDLIDVSAGLRILLPIKRLRILFETTLGDSIVLSEAQVNGLERFESSDARFTVYLAAGLQYRLRRHLSLGLLVEWAIPTSRAAQDFVAEASRVADTGEMMSWTSVAGTAAFHF